MTKLQEIEEIIEKLPFLHKANMRAYIKVIKEEHSDYLLTHMKGYANAMGVAGYITCEEYLKFGGLILEDFAEVA